MTIDFEKYQIVNKQEIDKLIEEVPGVGVPIVQAFKTLDAQNSSETYAYQHHKDNYDFTFELGGIIDNQRDGAWLESFIDYNAAFGYFRTGSYKNDLKEGQWISEDRGISKSVSNYHKGNLHGSQEWHYLGTKMTGELSHGNGIILEYDTNNSITGVKVFKDNKVDYNLSKVKNQKLTLMKMVDNVKDFFQKTDSATRIKKQVKALNV